MKLPKMRKYRVVVTTGGRIVCFQMRSTLFVSFCVSERNAIKIEFIEKNYEVKVSNKDSSSLVVF